MPGGDRTGPAGQGPGTGRGMGYCSGNTTPGYAVGRAFGAGRGWRNRYWATGIPGWQRFGGGGAWNRGFNRADAPVLPVEEEIVELKAEAESMKKALDESERRITGLSGKKEEKE